MFTAIIFFSLFKALYIHIYIQFVQGYLSIAVYRVGVVFTNTYVIDGTAADGIGTT